MKVVIAALPLLLFYPILLITSLIARSMAVVSATLANALIFLVFWTKSPKLIDFMMKKFDFEKQ
jgi:hypothetical protein